jgi:hypothetical protein
MENEVVLTETYGDYTVRVCKAAEHDYFYEVYAAGVDNSLNEDFYYSSAAFALMGAKRWIDSDIRY